MLAWSEGTDNGRPENQKIMNLWRHCERAIYWLLRSPSQKLVTLNPKLKSTGAGRYSFFPVGGMPTASSLAWKTSLRKVRTLWHCGRLRSVALYYDWSWWYPSGNRPLQQYLSFLPGAGYGQFEHKADSLITQIQRSGRNGQRLMYEQRSHRDYLPLWLSASSSACHGLLIITVITPLPTKPSATKMPENEAGERGNYWHANASAWCCCARCKIRRS